MEAFFQQPPPFKHDEVVREGGWLAGELGPGGRVGCLEGRALGSDTRGHFLASVADSGAGW